MFFWQQWCNRFFEEIDSNDDKHVSRSELENAVKKIKFGTTAEEAVTKFLQVLDVNGDDEISENEFVDGITELINSYFKQGASSESPSHHETHQVFPLFLYSNILPYSIFTNNVLTHQFDNKLDSCLHTRLFVLSKLL